MPRTRPEDDALVCGLPLSHRVLSWIVEEPPSKGLAAGFPLEGIDTNIAFGVTVKIIVFRDSLLEAGGQHGLRHRSRYLFNALDC